MCCKLFTEKKSQTSAWSIAYLYKWKHFSRHSFFFCFNLFVSQFFSLLFAFFSSKLLWNNYMHYEIINSYYWVNPLTKENSRQKYYFSWMILFKMILANAKVDIKWQEIKEIVAVYLIIFCKKSIQLDIVC